jgi:hypothetical protein
MNDLQILMMTIQACVLLWFVYRIGYHYGKINGIESAMGFIDGELKRLKKMLEDKIDEAEHTTK